MKTITAETPFQFCEKCKHFEMQETKLYSNSESPYATLYRCKYSNFCENAVALYKESKCSGKIIDK